MYIRLGELPTEQTGDIKIYMGGKTWKQQELFKDQLTERDDFAGLPHFEAPKGDNECLLEYQYQYKINGKRQALADMYRLGVEICKKMISQKAKTNKHIKKLDADEREEKAIDATNYIIMRLMNRPDWYIKTSFTAYLYLRLLHELFYRRKVDSIIDYVDIDDFYRKKEQ